MIRLGRIVDQVTHGDRPTIAEARAIFRTAFPDGGEAAAPPLGQTYDPPCLVYDPLGRPAPLPRADARKVVREVLTRKFGWDARDPHVLGVVRSFRDDPVRLRPPRYAPAEPSPSPAHGR